VCQSKAVFLDLKINIYFYHMEKPPNGETALDNQQEQELSFDQKVALATTLFQAVDDRNVFI